MGRPSKYTEAIVQEICERLSKGEPLAAVCRDEHMPGCRTVYDWMEERPDVSASIARAREEGEEALLAGCLEIANEPTEKTQFGAYDGGHIQDKKLRIDTTLKLLAKWNPKKWGDKVDVTSGGETIPAPIIQLAYPKQNNDASNEMP
jgi:hypothetical protein